MKVLLLCYERSGSTILIEILKDYYKCKRLAVDKIWSRQEDIYDIDALTKHKELVYKSFVIEKLKDWNKTLLNMEWDLVIFLKRNMNDMMISIEHAMKSNNWIHPYKINPRLKVSELTKNHYKQSFKNYNELYSDYKGNKVEIEYEKLYHETTSIRKKEIKKILGGKITNVIIERLSPKHKYTIATKTELI